MKIFKTISEIKHFNSEIIKKNNSVGFVPTMGALHNGHGSLVEKCKNECDITIVSIFVNPTQFNNLTDYEKYPSTLENDLKFLEKLNCDAVFIPSVDEIYAKDFKFPSYEIGFLDKIMEGLERPGHFKGVVQVVYRLFEIIKPSKAFFGLKDYQQLSVIKNMTTFFNLPIEIIPCLTVREKDGLAMSSRNLRLNSKQRKEADFIFNSLIFAKNNCKKYSPIELEKIIVQQYKKSTLKLGYFEIINPITFEKLSTDWVIGAVACVVANLDDIRLIDNMVIYE